MVVVGIFNADASVLGELRYTLSKLTGQSSCALCDITNGWNPFGKKSWKEACAESELQIDLIHRNEATLDELRVAEPLPAFITEKNNEWKVLMRGQEMPAFQNNPSALLAELIKRC